MKALKLHQQAVDIMQYCALHSVGGICMFTSLVESRLLLIQGVDFAGVMGASRGLC